ncbi:transposase [Photobacterium sp. BZF1]|uniref:IS66 family transposase n=1 Tax=Photobacterium sp. BZF1 TaxID=1904457 RepID=UPI00351CB444
MRTVFMNYTNSSDELKFISASTEGAGVSLTQDNCHQCENQAESVTISQKPALASLIPKSFATESLLPNIILGKYQYALPLYRQETLFKQSGIDLSRTTMARMGHAGQQHFTRLY